MVSVGYRSRIDNSDTPHVGCPVVFERIREAQQDPQDDSRSLHSARQESTLGRDGRLPLEMAEDRSARESTLGSWLAVEYSERYVSCCCSRIAKSDVFHAKELSQELGFFAPSKELYKSTGQRTVVVDSSSFPTTNVLRDLTTDQLIKERAPLYDMTWLYETLVRGEVDVKFIYLYRDAFDRIRSHATQFGVDFLRTNDPVAGFHHQAALENHCESYIKHQMIFFYYMNDISMWRLAKYEWLADKADKCCSVMTSLAEYVGSTTEINCIDSCNKIHEQASAHAKLKNHNHKDDNLNTPELKKYAAARDSARLQDYLQAFYSIVYYSIV